MAKEAKVCATQHGWLPAHSGNSARLPACDSQLARAKHHFATRCIKQSNRPQPGLCLTFSSCCI